MAPLVGHKEERFPTSRLSNWLAQQSLGGSKILQRF